MARNFLLLLIGLAMGLTKGGLGKESVQCVLDGRRYALGDTWHPVLPPFGAMPCVNCSCGQSGEVDCISQTCPKPDCAHPKIIPDKCCPSCEAAEEVESEGPDPTLGCDFYGKTYSDGDKFPSNRTALQPTKQGQCVLCVCTRGRVLCHLKSCPAVRCRDGYISVANDCCPKCKEDVIETQKEGWLVNYTSAVNKILLTNKSVKFRPHDCLGVDGVRLNGTTWTPTVPPFGRMRCVQCSCLNGRIECRRKKCPDDSRLRCKRPRKVEGECCKSCRKGGRRRRPNRNPRPSSTPTETPASRPPRTQATPVRRLTEDTLRKLCLPKRMDRLVYQTNSSSSVSVVFDILKKSRVEVLTWTIRRGRLSVMRREMLPADNYRKQTSVSEVVGSTNKRHYKKFKRRLARQFKRCEKKRSCRLKHLLKSLKKLRTRKVRFSEGCAGDKN